MGKTNTRGRSQASNSIQIKYFALKLEEYHQRGVSYIGTSCFRYHRNCLDNREPIFEGNRVPKMSLRLKTFFGRASAWHATQAFYRKQENVDRGLHTVSKLQTSNQEGCSKNFFCRSSANCRLEMQKGIQGRLLE